VNRDSPLGLFYSYLVHFIQGIFMLDILNSVRGKNVRSEAEHFFQFSIVFSLKRKPYLFRLYI